MLFASVVAVCCCATLLHASLSAVADTAMVRPGILSVVCLMTVFGEGRHLSVSDVSSVCVLLNPSLLFLCCFCLSLFPVVCMSACPSFFLSVLLVSIILEKLFLHCTLRIFNSDYVHAVDPLVFFL